MWTFDADIWASLRRGEAMAQQQVQIVSSIASEELSFKYSDLVSPATAAPDRRRSSDDNLVPIRAPFCLYLGKSPQAATWLRDYERRRRASAAAAADGGSAVKRGDPFSSGRLLLLKKSKEKMRKRWSPWKVGSSALFFSAAAPEFGCAPHRLGAVPPVRLPKPAQEVL